MASFTMFEEGLANLMQEGWEPADNIKVALITNAVVPAASDPVPALGAGGTTNYTECSAGGNYSAGGETLDTIANMVTEAGGTLTFADTGSFVTWLKHASNPTNAYYAIVYHDASNLAIGFIDLGGVFDMTTGDLKLNWDDSAFFDVAPAA